MIDTLVQYKVFKLEELHVIGFSLGGQVAGQVGQFVKSGKITRITGLFIRALACYDSDLPLR